MYTALILMILWIGETWRIHNLVRIKNQEIITPLPTVVYAFPWELPAQGFQEIATELI
jgi:hypothetical protein